MNESVAITKEADAKKSFSPTRNSDEGIHRYQTEPEQQLGSLRGVIGDIRRNGGTPSAAILVMAIYAYKRRLVSLLFRKHFMLLRASTHHITR